MLRIYNTQTGEKEKFAPIKEGEVGIYACGVTVYDDSHIGHARGAVIFDVVKRYLTHRGYKVNYVRNFTDIDDKIIKRAAEAGIAWNELAEKYTQEYIKDMTKLGVARADIEPKATEHIPEIIAIIKKIQDNGYAYKSGGDVFFSVRKFKGYGKLSGKSIDDMLSGARVDVNEKKEDPLDFVLWKASKPGEPAWDSPWGLGRPGWHIECSAMSMKHIGETLDIHGGGMDLTFPHHENEIAQSEAANGKEFVRLWMHNGFVNVNREKMSKSLGNFFTIKQILELYDPEVVRFFLLSTHYRNPIDFSDQSLQEARTAVDRYYTMLEGINKALIDLKPSDDQGSPASLELYKKTAEFNGRFEEAMDDDFNTALAIGIIFEMVREINKTLTEPSLKTDISLMHALMNARNALKDAAGILNIFGRDPEEWFGRTKKYIEIKNVAPEDVRALKEAYDELEVELVIDHNGVPVVSSDQLDSLIRMRRDARAAKDWNKADRIRDVLTRSGIELLDTPEGTKWQIRE